MLTVYKQALHEAGRDYVGIAMARELVVGPPDIVSMLLQKYNAPYYEDVYKRWNQPGEDYTKRWQHDFGNRVVCGTSAEVAHQIIDEHRRTGCQLMNFRVYWPGMPVDLSIDMIHRLGREVLPVVRDAVGADCTLLPPFT
jgi:hypothetical protein